MIDEQPAVVVKDLHKTFKLPLENHSGIKQVIVNAAKRKKGYSIQKVLSGVSFEIKKGEFFGIVGRNGSGKSTLLKLLAGIYVPDSGLVQVNGSLTPFIELGVGFNPELTGYENVFLNGALLGFSRNEMEDMYSDIVEFAELEKFMDQKLKNYSSGMQVRLAFSIAIRAQSDILLLDEVLAVGDEAFQRKCFSYFEELKRNNKTVILVTHDMGSVKKFCSRAMLIENGQIKIIGSPNDVANQYSSDNLGIVENEVQGTKEKKSEQRIFLSDPVTELKIVNKSSKILSNNDDLVFEVIYKSKNDQGLLLGIGLSNNNVSLVEHNTLGVDPVDLGEGRFKYTYRLPLNLLNGGEYRLNATIIHEATMKLIAYTKDRGNLTFIIKSEGLDTDRVGGILNGKGSWV